MFLDKASRKSHGGTCKVWVYDLANGVTTWPDVVNLSFVDEIEFPGENDWSELHFTEYSSRPKEDRVEIDGSPAYAFELKGVAHEDTAARRNTLHEAERKNYLLKYTDQNGVTKIVGSPDEPVSIITSSVDNGATYANGTPMSISVQCTNKLPFAQYDF